MSGEPPLARLFATAFRTLIDGLNEELRERGWDGVRPAFGFALLAVRDRPTTTVSDIAELMGSTKQAASKLVETMEADGLVTRTVDAVDTRRRPVVLTERGRSMLDAVESIYADLEEAWAREVGRDAVEQVRRTLVDVLVDADGELPAVRPTW